MAAPTSQNEVTARKLSDTISGLWGKIKDTFSKKSEGVYYIAGTTSYANWAASTAYAVNDEVVYSGKAYYCKTAHTSGSSWDSSKWTAIATPILKGSITGITALTAGLKIAYKMPITGGTSSTYLNINNLGNVYIRRNDSNTTTHLPANTVVFLAYDGSYWRWSDYADGNDWATTIGAYCTTGSSTQAKTATSTNTVYTTGETFLIKFNNSNTYDGKITLNINSQGAKDVWINGAVSSSSNKTLPAGEHWCHYDGSVFHIWTDGTAQFTKLKLTNKLTDANIASASTWNAKQDALATQTAYSAKGTATKVPQITTNSLGQVTGITEVTISGVTPASHTHGNIQNGGTLQTNDITIASGDKLVVTDSSDSNKVARTSISFDGSTATKALTQKGTFETFNNYSHPTYTAADAAAKKIGRDASGHVVIGDSLGKSDVGLGSVVNTGDSATPVSGGTTKFTTGGAYTELAKKADLASPALTGTPTAPTATAGTNTTQIATTAFVKTATTNLLAEADAMLYKGTVAGGSTGNYGALTPAADKGHTYKVTTAGKIDGVAVEVGDMLICNTDSTAAATSSNYSTIADNWDFVQTNLDGVVIGPSSVTSGRVATFDGTTGKLIKDSGYTIAKSVPSDAVFTDTNTKVTSSANHYTPATASGSDVSASASGATAAWSIDVVKGVTLNTDGKGHVTGLSVTSGKIPANPNTDTKVKATAKTDNVNYKILATSSASPTSGNATEAVYDADITLNPSTNTITANISGDAATASAAKSGSALETALSGKSATSHTHSVKINGSTKTIAASGGTAVDLDYHPTARAASATTVTGLIQEVRVLPGGSVGSVQLTADNTVENVKIPADWYNYIWTPHRAGASGGDHQHYGSLILMSMTSASPQTFVVEGANLAGDSPKYRCRMLSQVAAMGSAYFGNNAKYRRIGVLSGPSETGDTCATFLVCISRANVNKQAGILNVDIRNSGGTYTFNISLTELTGAASWTSRLKLFKGSDKLYLYGLGASGAYYSVEVTPLAVTDLTGTQVHGMWTPDTSNTDESSVAASYTAITYSTTQYVAKSSTSGLLKNDGTVDTTQYVAKSSTLGLLANDGSVSALHVFKPSVHQYGYTHVLTADFGTVKKGVFAFRMTCTRGMTQPVTLTGLLSRNDGGTIRTAMIRTAGTSELAAIYKLSYKASSDSTDGRPKLDIWLIDTGAGGQSERRLQVEVLRVDLAGGVTIGNNSTQTLPSGLTDFTQGYEDAIAAGALVSNTLTDATTSTAGWAVEAGWHGQSVAVVSPTSTAKRTSTQGAVNWSSDTNIDTKYLAAVVCDYDATTGRVSTERPIIKEVNSANVTVGNSVQWGGYSINVGSTSTASKTISFIFT